MAASSQPVPMEVDQVEQEDDAAAGLRLYGALAKELLAQLPSTSASPGLQLLVELREVAKLWEQKEAILALLKEGSTEGLSEELRAVASATKAKLTEAGTWPQVSALKAKKVFGHKSVVKSIQLPNLPKTTHGNSIFLPQGPSSPDSIMFKSGDAIAALESTRMALVLQLDSFLPGAVLVVSPALASADRASMDESTVAKQVSDMLLKEPEVWRKLIRAEQDFFRGATLQNIRQVLDIRSVAALTTPRKPVAGTPVTSQADLESPPKQQAEKPAVQRSMKPMQDSDDIAQRAYSTLLASLFEEQDYFAEEFQGMDWLNIKKQLLVYHHAAKLNEEKDAILADLKEDKEKGDVIAKLPETYRKAVNACRSEVHEILAGQKTKKMFSHDHVIRFHSIKGVPVPRTSCVFLRERPQSSKDILRVTPSIFRDLVRFRSNGSPLMELEEHGLGLVLYVNDKKPRAFLVISPLFEQPEALEKVADKSWGEITASLRNHLNQLIARESDAWRAFIQRHADVVSRDSLKIIQKVLKGCAPGAGSGAFTNSVEDLEELTEQREQIAMAHAEREMRIVVRFEEALQEVCGDSVIDVKKAKAQAKARQQTALDKLKDKLKDGAEKTKEEAVAKARQEGEDAALAEFVKDQEEARRTQQETRRALDESRLEVSQLSREVQETKIAYEQQESDMQKKQEEIIGLADMQQELLHSIASMETSVAKERQEIRTKNTALKQQLQKEKHLTHEKTKEQEQLKKQLLTATEATNAAEQRLVEAEGKAAEAIAEAVSEAEAKAVNKVEEAEAKAAEKVAEAEAKAVNKVQEAEAKIAEAQKKTAEAETTARDARAAEAKAQAEMEIKASTAKQLTESNIALRTELAQAAEAAATAKQDAAKAKEDHSQCLKELAAANATAEAEKKVAQEAQAEAKKTVEKAEKAEMDAAKKASTAEEAATSAKKAEKKAQAELKVKTEESTRLTESCTALTSSVQQAKQSAADAKEHADRMESEKEEAKQAAMKSQAELEVSQCALASTKESNASLRTELAEAKETLPKALADAARSEEEAKKAKEAEKEALAQLEKSSSELVAAARKAAEAEQATEKARAEAQEAVRRADAAEQSVEERVEQRVAAAEAAAKDSEKAEKKAQAELKVKTEETTRLTDSCVELTGAASRAKQAAADAEMRSAAMEKVAEEAKKETIQKQVELEVSKSALASIQEVNTEVRKEIAAIKMLVEKEQRRAEEAEKAKQQSKESEDKALKEAEKAKADTAAAKRKVSTADSNCKKAREELEKVSAEVADVRSTASAATKAAAAAKAKLVAQTRQAKQLSEACAKLRADVAASRERADKAEKRALVAESERAVALAASDITEAEVSRLARGGDAPAKKRRTEEVEPAASKEAEPAEQTVAPQSPSKRPAGDEPSSASKWRIEDDIELALTQQMPELALTQQEEAAAEQKDPLFDIWGEAEAKEAKAQAEPSASKLKSSLRGGKRSRGKASSGSPKKGKILAFLKKGGKSSEPKRLRIRGKRSEPLVKPPANEQK